ncbi:MAG: dihydroorotase [Bacteroidia bacterium]|jgi:dihydroorotase
MKKHAVLFKNVRIAHPESNLHHQLCSILVRDGIIHINAQTDNSFEIEVFDCSGLLASPGLYDFQVTGGEPGFEERETFESLSNAAMRGGVTSLNLMPDLLPVTDHRGAAAFIHQSTADLPVEFVAAGALSVGMKGKDLTEMVALKQEGVAVFTDDKSALSNTLLLHLALQYTKLSGGIVMLHPDDAAITQGALVNEGESSTRLGLKSAPEISEILGIQRAITLAQYHDVPIFIAGISCAKSVDIIREAKSAHIKVYCSTYPHHLLFNDGCLEKFDSNYKVWPPLRSENDRIALIQGLRDGTIDVLCSDHRPEPIEHKDVEFAYARFGIEGIECLYAAARKALNSDSDIDVLIRALSINPRKIVGKEIPRIEDGAPANFFIYTPAEQFTFTEEMIFSKSSNSPYPGMQLQGKIYGTCTSKGWFFDA